MRADRQGVYMLTSTVSLKFDITIVKETERHHAAIGSMKVTVSSSSSCFVCMCEWVKTQHL